MASIKEKIDGADHKQQSKDAKNPLFSGCVLAKYKLLCNFGENMSYFSVLGLEKEPFSTSPDPEFFYLSKEHDQALTNILIELHLRRGLSVVLGDIGTGKTTLSRKLIQCLKQRGDFLLSIILDPCFRSERMFLLSILNNFGPEIQENYCEGCDMRNMNVLDLRDVLQRYLYDKCILDNKTVVVIVDEAQKVGRAALEVLRTVLNYETNQNKLLQVVLLGQLELHPKITSMPNFLDRVSFKYMLNPLGVSETQEMIQYRLKKAGFHGMDDLFSYDGIKALHEVSKGYPRKTNLLCHKALKRIVMQGKWCVTRDVIFEITDEEVRSGWLNPILR